jgi:hypothetical protein
MPAPQPPMPSETPPGVVADDASAPRVATEGGAGAGLGAVVVPDVEYVHYYNAVVAVPKRPPPAPPAPTAEPDDGEDLEES